MGKDDLKVLSDMLGTNTFFFGSEPTTVSVLISLTFPRSRYLVFTSL